MLLSRKPLFHHLKMENEASYAGAAKSLSPIEESRLSDKQPPHSELTGSYVAEVRSTDVLCGRGTGPSNHRGNVNFRRMVEVAKKQYVATASRRLKNKLVQDVVDQIKRKEGRFLRQLSRAEVKLVGFPVQKILYEVVPDAVSIEKVKQAIRYVHYKKEPNEGRTNSLLSSEVGSVKRDRDGSCTKMKLESRGGIMLFPEGPDAKRLKSFDSSASKEGAATTVQPVDHKLLLDLMHGGKAPTDLGSILASRLAEAEASFLLPSRSAALQLQQEQLRQLLHGYVGNSPLYGSLHNSAFLSPNSGTGPNVLSPAMIQALLLQRDFQEGDLSGKSFLSSAGTAGVQLAGSPFSYQCYQRSDPLTALSTHIGAGLASRQEHTRLLQALTQHMRSHGGEQVARPVQADTILKSGEGSKKPMKEKEGK